MADEKRQVAIKSGSVKRLAKELALYEKEREAEQAKVAKLKAEGADSHDVKHAEDVLAEATMIIPDTRQRLLAALEDLEQYKESVADKQANSEVWETVDKVVAEAQTLLQA